jgi:small GTP-binding protein
MSSFSSSLNCNFEILPEDYTQYDLSFKLIVVGDSGVGKSCITNKATKDTFDESYNATVGFEFFTFNIKLSEKVIKLQIWDTCGQEQYHSLITNFYRNSSLAIIVYAVNDKESFDNVEMWLRELRTHSSPDIKVFLIGNKIDLTDNRVVKTEEGEAYAKQNKFNKFIESSAKDGINAKEIFIDAAKLLFDDYMLYNGNTDEDSDENSYESFKANRNTRNSAVSKISATDDKVNKIQIGKKKKGGCC